MHVRMATREDAAAISKLIRRLTVKYVLPTCENQVHEILLNSMTPERILQYLESNYYYLVAESNNQLIGVAGLRDYTHLYHLFVCDKHQGLGIAKTLWQTIKCDAQRINKTLTFTVNSAINAESVYLSFGFKRVTGIRNRDGMIDIPMTLSV